MFRVKILVISEKISELEYLTRSPNPTIFNSVSQTPIEGKCWNSKSGTIWVWFPLSEYQGCLMANLPTSSWQLGTWVSSHNSGSPVRAQQQQPQAASRLAHRHQHWQVLYNSTYHDLCTSIPIISCRTLYLLQRKFCLLYTSLNSKKSTLHGFRQNAKTMKTSR